MNEIVSDFHGDSLNQQDDSHAVICVSAWKNSETRLSRLSGSYCRVALPAQGFALHTWRMRTVKQGRLMDSLQRSRANLYAVPLMHDRSHAASAPIVKKLEL